MKLIIFKIFSLLALSSSLLFADASEIPLLDLISDDKPLPTIGIIVAHPDRVQRIGCEFLEDVELHSNYRGYKVYTGNYHGQSVFAVYTAMGGPSVAMIVENLILAGAKKIVRIGTSDNHDDEQDLTTLLIITETMGLKGLMEEYGYCENQLGKPLPASPEIIQAILASAQKNKAEHVKLTKAYNIDAFHVFTNPQWFAKNPEKILKKINYYKSQGATVRDMESGTLLMLGQLRGIEAGCVLIPAIKSNQANTDVREETKRLEGDAIRIVLDALTLNF